MGVKKIGRKSAKWRKDSPEAVKVRRKLSRAGVLKDSESCLGFLESLKARGLMYTLQWEVTDKMYMAYFDESRRKREDLGEVKNRYYKLFRVQDEHLELRTDEHFPREYRYTPVVDKLHEYSLSEGGEE